jgi:hypothetical protein
MASARKIAAAAAGGVARHISGESGGGHRRSGNQAKIWRNGSSMAKMAAISDKSGICGKCGGKVAGEGASENGRNGEKRRQSAWRKLIGGIWRVA